jgi:hypothetical protein
MNMFRCLICGRTYFFESRPSSCPFCLAEGTLIVSAERWEEPTIKHIPDSIREEITDGIRIEHEKCCFYRTATKEAKGAYNKGFFKASYRIAHERLILLSRTLSLKPEPISASHHPQLIKKAHWFNRAYELETQSAQFYKDVGWNCLEPRMKQVFSSFVAGIEKQMTVLTHVANFGSQETESDEIELS